MNLVAFVCYYRETREWSVSFTRDGTEHQVCFSASELIALEQLFDYLAGVGSRCPVDHEWTGRGQKLELRIHPHGPDGWWIGSENVA